MLEAFFRKQLAVFLILDIRCTFLKQEMATNTFVFLKPPPPKNQFGLRGFPVCVFAVGV